MYANFIYIIVALLIYSTYQPSEVPNFSAHKSVLLLLFFLAFYTAFTWLQFQRLNKKRYLIHVAQRDAKFTALLTQQTIIAILIFAVDIYGLGLSSFLLEVQLFLLFPTLQALLFMLLFLSYLAILWSFAHKTHNDFFDLNIKKTAYVWSNISFSLPVLLPWILLSGMADILRILPFKFPRHFLSTPEGEAVYFMIFLMGVAVVGPLLIQKFWRCRPLESGNHRQQIETLCRQAGMGFKDILHWPIFEGRVITAGVMGLIKRFRYILVTRALLNLLNPDEIDAVIAHEIGHVQRRHLLFYLFFFVGYMLISFSLLDLIVYTTIYFNPLIALLSQAGFHSYTATSFVISLVFIATFLIYFRLIFGFFMRNFERQADVHVYSILDSARSLISTLKKISIAGRQSADKPNWHHFSIKERIDFLTKCEADRSHVFRHHKKVRKSIILYASILVIVCLIGYQLNYGETGRILNTHFFEKAVMREIERTPDSADLYTMLGDLHLNRRNFNAAGNAYEKAIQLDKHYHRALNNLAWLYATCEDISFRNPSRSLALAQRAAAVKTAPYILDTLAESYYVNGFYDEAVETEIQAFAIAKKDRAYYERQIRKFKAAVENNQ